MSLSSNNVVELRRWYDSYIHHGAASVQRKRDGLALNLMQVNCRQEGLAVETEKK